MPNVRLTKRAIEALPQPRSGQVLYRDEELTGFGLRVGSKTKTFFAEGQVRRRTIRLTLGRYPLVSREEARRIAFENLAAMARGVDPTVEKKAAEARAATVEEAFEAFFEAKPGLSLRTVDNYKRTPKLYLKDWLKLPLQEITRNMVLAKHRKISKDHGAITANCVFRHLRSVYNFIASLHDEFPTNPVMVLSKTRSWAPERRRRTLIAAHQLPAWWRAIMAESEDARDFLLVALFTGMRRNEIATLKWEHVDLIGCTLTVPKTKNGDPLVLPLSGFLVDLIARRRETVGQSEWVFPGPGVTGHIVETKSFTRRVSEASGVDFSLHDLRRTFITVAESLDIPAYALKRLLNHRADGDVTGGYIVMSADRLRAPVERVAMRIFRSWRMVRKDRKPWELPLAEVPQHIAKSLEHDPELAGMGNSTDPRDNIWSGYRGDFDIDAALAVDGDPEGALAQIVTAIVNSNAGAESEYERDGRINKVVAKMLGRKVRPGPRPGDSDQGKKRDVLPRAAYLVYTRRLDPKLGSSEWKACIWDASAPRQIRQRYSDGPEGEKFSNFYNECMKFMRDNGNEDRLLLEASVRDKGVGEINLEQARWRQDTIDRVIHDLTKLGIVKP